MHKHIAHKYTQNRPRGASQALYDLGLRPPAEGEPGILGEQKEGDDKTEGRTEVCCGRRRAHGKARFSETEEEKTDMAEGS